VGHTIELVGVRAFAAGSSCLCRLCYFGLVNHHAALGGGDQLAEGIPHPAQARTRRTAVENDVKPVAIAQIPGAAPFVFDQFDIANPRL
jgi:hypothetical protein